MRARNVVPLQESPFDYLEAIRQAPDDDDAPRLAYADWLELNGDHDRAEFIRLQCWLSANPESHPEWDGKWQREQALLRKNLRVWTFPFVDALDWGDQFWDRGFPSFLAVHSPYEFALWAEYLANVTATNRLVIGWTNSIVEDVTTLLSCPELAAIRELWLNDEGRGFPATELTEFLCSPLVQRLTRLDFGGTRTLNYQESEFLAANPVLPHLQFLGLGLAYPVEIKTIIPLLQSPFRSSLRGLTVWYLDSSDVKTLCNYAELSRLTHLDLGSWHVTESAVRSLIECPYLDNIRYLSFNCDADDSRANLSDSTIAAFFGRFGDSGNLSETPYIGGSEKEMHRWRMVTGRSR